MTKRSSRNAQIALLATLAIVPAGLTGASMLGLISRDMAVAALPPIDAKAQTDPMLVASIDPNPTSAVGRPDLLSTQDTVEVLRSGLDALTARDIPLARQIRDGMPNGSLDRNVLSWSIAMRGGGLAPGAEIAATAAALRDWPGADTLRRNGERALLSENAAPDIVIATFHGAQPETIEGVIALTRAYVDAGNLKAAQSVLLPSWRRDRLEAVIETRILKEFAAIIPPADHRIRMERMLYAGRVASAQKVAVLANAKELWTAWAAAIRDDKQTAKLLAAVPVTQRSAGYTFVRAKQLRQQEKFADAAALMLKAPTDAAALIDPDAWWAERRVLSRELLDIGDIKTAYRVASAHSAESPVNAAEAEFHAGWYALRGLNDPATAAKHFARIAAVASGPISLSRAYYWMGRAADAGGPGNAKEFYAKAAAFGTTFYGQLAAEKTGGSRLNLAAPAPSETDRLTFLRREPVRAIERLEKAGYGPLAETMYRELAAELTAPGELAMLAGMAEHRGDSFLALKLAKIASSRGIDIGGLTHPVGAIPATADISGSGKALAYAIARQESEFNTGAVSKAGALGLLQLMPGTAEEIARRSGLPFSRMRLTTDPGYNATLGAAFLGEQLDRFDGSYVLTFAGYNAGPTRARQWIKRYGDPRGKDIDTVVDWIERIPYGETRSYVQRVMENYQVYKMRLSGRFDIERDLISGRS